MLNLAIAILWLCIAVIILGAVIWIALNVVRKFFPNMDSNVDYAVWAIFGILILIYILQVLAGGALPTPHLHLPS
jgi:hypothetical protein